MFRGDGEFGVSTGLRGGAGRTRTGNQTRGRIPDKQLPQDDDTTARFAAKCQSFLRPSSMPCSCAPDSELCRPGLITVWLPVRVLPAPPRSPPLTEISCGWTNTHGFAEAVQLRWADIDLPGERIFIKRLKSGVDSTQPLSGIELRYLKQLRRKNPN